MAVKKIKKSDFLLLGLFSAWFLIMVLALSGEIMSAGMSPFTLVLGAVCLLALVCVIITVCPKPLIFFAGALASFFSAIDSFSNLNVLASMGYLLLAYALYGLGLYFLE